jgi:hypothetical protein
MMDMDDVNRIRVNMESCQNKLSGIKTFPNPAKSEINVTL